MGSGRTETMRLLFGADRADQGEVYLQGAEVPVKIDSPTTAVRQGLAFLTEDRKEQGLLLDLPLRVNISLTRLGDLSRWGWMDAAAEQAVAARYVETLSIRCSSPEQKTQELSGGNQQKVVMGKWLFRDSRILIFDEPTRGIDVGAKFEIYRLLADLAEKGKAIIFLGTSKQQEPGARPVERLDNRGEAWETELAQNLPLRYS